MVVTNKKPLVSIVILNWNRIKDTLVCLESVRKLKYKNTEIIVVDNGSIDGSKEILSKIDGIIFVDNPKNRGFTGGHIDGLNASTGEFILLLNNDAVIDAEYVSRAIETMLANKDVGAVGGRSYEWGGDKNPAFSTKNPYFAYQNINPITGEGIFSRLDNGKVQVVNNVSGSGVLVRRSVVDTIGYLYEPFFAYYEETDLFARMKRAGYRVIYNPKLYIWHKSGASSSSYFQYYQIFKNRFIFSIRNFDKGYLWKFIRSYVKIGLISTYLRFRKPENKTLHKAFSNAFIHSCLTWPFAYLSRLRLSRTNGGKTLLHNYNSAIINEQVSLSIIIDMSDMALPKVKKYITDLENAYSNFSSNFEIVLLVNPTVYTESAFTMVKVLKSNIKNRFNIGWLSASGGFIYFHKDSNKIPDINSIIKEAGALKSKNKWMSYSKDNLILVNRELLIHCGGLVETSKTTRNGLAFFAHSWHKPLINLSREELIELESELTISTQREIKSAVHIAKQTDKQPSLWARFLSRHYRVFQGRNFLKWVFSRKITLRLKAARIKNLIKFAFLLDRKRFATELKHIRNEVLKLTFLGVNIDKQNDKIKLKLNEAMKNSNWRSIPIFIICRDRIDQLQILIKWLEKISMTNIIFIDNDSIYPPLVEFLDKTKYQVIKTQKNIGHTVPWTGGIIRSLCPEDIYIVTDPDIIPIDECPDDVIVHFLNIHLKYPAYKKVGFGLKIDDLPETYTLRNSVIEWENQFWKNKLEDNVYEAGVDTTFALYKPFNYTYTVHPSIRTGEPYTARHLPWYSNSKKLTGEDVFYKDRADGNITSWNVDVLPGRYKKEMKIK